MLASINPKALTRKLGALWKAWFEDEAGAEIVQFVLALPILLGVVWTSFEAWQVISLREAVRATVAQAGRYVTAYGAPPEIADAPPDPDTICWGVEQLVARSLAQQRGNLGDNLAWTLRWYKVLDPSSARWEGNLVEMSCQELLSEFECNQQFALELEVSVPWQTVLFGLGRSVTTREVLRITDSVTGSAPCLPYFDLWVWGSVAPDSCRARVCWGFDSSYAPNRCEIWVAGTLLETVYNPVDGQCHEPVYLPPGGGSVDVVCYGGRRETSNNVDLDCPEE